MLYQRVETDEKKGKENIQWTSYVVEISLTHNNNLEHSAFKVTPKGMKEMNGLKAKNDM